VSKEFAISVKDISFSYRTQVSRKPNFMEAARNLGRGNRSTVKIDALKNISFDIEIGEVVGIVGANGAGKSTLMRALGGIVPPDKGRIEVRGEISALLALGVGFNPLLTGRENVILAGLATGQTREYVDEQFEKILEFSELEEFIDAYAHLLFRHV
jgi:ABC-type polysaccharide/polyol phosphate transport system ATPase subunit